MIELTRLNHHPLIVNSDLIKFIEKAPDTVITLMTGEKIVVAETVEQVMERFLAFRRQLLAGLSPLTATHSVPAAGNSQAQDDSEAG